MIKYRVAVLIACHNRRDKTKKCLESLVNFFGNSFMIEVFLVDAGSSDGTPDMIKNAAIPVNLIRGDSSWFWSKSMAVGQDIILDSYSNSFDYLLWLNDDVELDVKLKLNWDSILFKFKNQILVGQLAQDYSHEMSYGGYQRYDSHPLHLKKIYYENEFGPIDTFSGSNTIAIGAYAAYASTNINVIHLNATGISTIDTSQYPNAFYANPIRFTPVKTGLRELCYDPVTFEVFLGAVQP
jgi:GT2 family glycosyltransferase